MSREMVLVPVDKYKYLIDKIELFENNSNNQTGGDLQDKAPPQLTNRINQMIFKNKNLIRARLKGTQEKRATNRFIICEK